ncbi:phenylacetate-CoA oxygenase/reductase subunit PaaK [soil metagenome]
MAQTMEIQKVEYPAADTITLRFKREGLLSKYLPGQHISVSVPVNGKNLTRTYSFCTSPYMDDDIVIAVRRIPDGTMSSFLLEQARPGMELEIEGPFGEFTTIPDHPKRHLIMFGGGSGITPLFSMIRSILYKESQSVITLIYANQTFERIIFYRQLEQLQKRFNGRLRVYHALEDASSAPPDASIFYEGMLNRLVVKKLVKDRKKEFVMPTAFYLCGPFGFMNMIEHSLLSLDIEADKLNKEHFFVPNQPLENDLDFDALPRRMVQIDWRGITHDIDVPTGCSILEAAQKAGLDLPHSCKEAQCDTCRSLLKNGDVAMKQNFALTEEEVEAGKVLICQGYSITDDIQLEPVNKPSD